MATQNTYAWGQCWRHLVEWQHAPHARLAHPREEHLIPLLVVAGAAGAAGADRGTRILIDHVLSVAMASYQFG